MRLHIGQHPAANAPVLASLHVFQCAANRLFARRYGCRRPICWEGRPRGGFDRKRGLQFYDDVLHGGATGGQVYISQLIGAGRKKELNRTIGTLFAMIEFFRRYMAWHFCVTADISWPLFPIVFSPRA